MIENRDEGEARRLERRKVERLCRVVNFSFTDKLLSFKYFELPPSLAWFSCSEVVITLDFESSIPSSNLGRRTSLFPPHGK